MKTRSLGIAFAALLAFAPVRGSAQDAASAAAPAKAASPAAGPSDPPASVPRPSIAPKTAEPAAAPAVTDATPRKKRRYARTLSPLRLLGAVPGLLAELLSPPPQLAPGCLVQLVLSFDSILRHGRARPGHPRLAVPRKGKTWMPGT